MGYQLWTSPLTGYRRHGTRLADFNAALGERILAKDICEPLKCCPSGAPADEMQHQLRLLDFTVAGVRDIDGGAITGFVREGELCDGSVQSHLHALSEVTIIDDVVPLQNLLIYLGREPFLFVRSPNEVSAILTWADLNKPIVRIYIFGLISLLEMHLSFWIAQSYVGESWQGVLTLDRVNLARDVEEKRAALGQELPLIQCLQMCDKRTLISKSDGIRARLGFASKKDCERFLKDVGKLRDSLAHSQYELAPGNSWQTLLSLIARMQTVVITSDELVEADAMDRSADFTNLLW